MNRFDEWETFDNIGALKIEKELIVGLEPLLFVGRTQNSQRYLIMTYDSCNGIYILSPTTTQKLLDMLQNKITMEDAYRHSDCIIRTKYNEDASLLIESEFNPLDFPSDMLPKKGSFFKINSKYINDYIDYLKKE